MPQPGIGSVGLSAVSVILVGFPGFSSEPEAQELSRHLCRLSGVTGNPDDYTPLADLRDVRARLFGYGRGEPLI